MQHQSSEPWHWLALSHCWGSHLPKSRLTTDKYESYVAGFNVEMLEQTFRDAVRVTLELGYQYLWIDTLCIMQDSEEDWQRECSLMKEIYTNADAVIAASVATDSTSGFLSRAQPISGRCEIPLSRNENASWGHFRIQMLSPPSPRGSLSLRAWTLQDMLLARRVLSFGHRQMSFRCIRDTRHETNNHPREFDELHLGDYNQGTINLVELDGASAETRANLFLEIVDFYCQRNLTWGNDRLPALSGIARKFHAYDRQDQYLAGLWRSHLVVGMAWCSRLIQFMPDMDRRTTRFSPTKTIPSWSWAWFEYPIEWPGFLRMRTQVKLWADVVDAHTNVVGLDPYGMVDGGQITLRAQVRRFQIDGYWKDIVGSKFRVVDHVGLEFIAGDCSRLNEDGKFALMGILLCSYAWFSSADDNMHDIFILAVDPCEGPGSRYRRMGLIHGLSFARKLNCANFGETVVLTLI